ncbi:hypothetical protein [Halorussus amylolyticus]|uniref:hypothetical protein n=1 Tax=Halorussus amylolyticus TaxID=1126242 RepID=UPI00192F3896|nr:hypothetical protein [Halorussus amylolyticus]
MTVPFFGRRVSRSRTLARVLQLIVLGVLAVGLLTRNAAVVVNAALGFLVTLLPGVLERDFRLPLDPRLGALIALSICLHTVGMLGIYETTWWWDHATHGLSASVVAVIGYTVTLAFDEHSEDVRFPPRFLAVFVFLFVVALGVIWEVLEFAANGAAFALGVRPVLIQYSLEDTMLDLVFDMVGALVVSAFATRHIRESVGAYAEWFDRRVGTDETDKETDRE